MNRILLGALAGLVAAAAQMIAAHAVCGVAVGLVGESLTDDEDGRAER